MSLSASQSDPLAGRLTVTVREARDVTGLCTMTLYRAMYRGKLDSRKIGRRRLIVVSSLRQLLNLEEQAAA